jgi:hypothetical protein
MRAALFRAAIDDRLGVKGALEAAQAGALQGLTADDQRVLASMAYGYACTLVKDERLRRGDIEKVRADVENQAHELAARLLALADGEVSRIERAKRAKPRSPVNTGDATAAAKMAREALALARDAAGTGKANGKAAAAPSAAPAKPASLAARIAAGSDAAAGEADIDASDGGDSRAPRDAKPTGKMNGGSGGAVRLRAASPAA